MTDLLRLLSFDKIHFRDQTVTLEALTHSVDEFAAHLDTNRQGRSPFVFLLAENHIKTVVAFFGILRAGMIVVPLHPRTTRLEIDDLAVSTPPAALVRGGGEANQFDLDSEIELYDAWDGPLDEESLSKVCMVCHTAAEDGYYKGAMLTEKNLLTLAQGTAECIDLQPESVSCSLAPFHHTFGLQTGLLVPMIVNASIYIAELDDFTKLPEIVARADELGVTNLYSVPLIYHVLMRVPGIESSFRDTVLFGCGGVKLTKRLFERFLQKTGHSIREGYGLTEASPTCTWHPSDDAIRIDSVGRAFCRVEVAIHDETGRDLPPGEEGEVVVRGGNVMIGYYNQPGATRRALRDGWLLTGDLGYLDDDGLLYLTGLKKHMLNVAGLNVYPAELARLVTKHEAVARAEIRGEASPVGGHTIVAHVELADGAENTKAEELLAWCRQNLSPFKVPKRIELTKETV